jgi:hypothetical protein
MRIRPSSRSLHPDLSFRILSDHHGGRTVLGAFSWQRVHRQLPIALSVGCVSQRSLHLNIPQRRVELELMYLAV